MFKRPPPPLWFVLLVGVLEALAWRYFVTSFDVADPRIQDPAFPQLAFWQFVIMAIGWIWTGVQVAGRITLQILAWSVKVLWAFATAVRNVAVAVGRTFVEFGHKAWDFLRMTYEDVLKPAWRHFWDWFDKLRGWLERTLRPVFDFLDRIRTFVLRFYDAWIRPILDTIDIARRVLGILASLGLDWARALDAKLRWLEEKIEAPFRLVLAKLNEIINVVNRVVTADGLFQRIAYIRTLERDMRYVSRAFVNWRSKPLTAAQRETLKSRLTPRPIEELRREAVMHVEGTGGPRAALITEMVQHWTTQIERR